MSKRQEAIQEQVKSLIQTAFIFERPDGTRGVTLKSSPRRKGFTVNLTDLTPDEAKIVGDSVTEVLCTLISDEPEAREFVEEKLKVWDGTRKDDKK